MPICAITDAERKSRARIRGDYFVGRAGAGNAARRRMVRIVERCDFGGHTLMSSIDPRSLEQASAAHLRYVNDGEAGIRRQRRGAKFRYVDAQGKVVRDGGTLARIASLAIPPAYEDVWICASDRGHLQATGRDARGRKQYRYHARWRGVRDKDKFGRIIHFAEHLPALRRRVQRDLRLPGLGRDKVLAIVVSVMAQTLIRVGNATYESSNGSYGLTTLHKRHLALLGKGRALFKFRGKGGLAHEVPLDDARLTRLLRRCRQLPGQALFQYTDEDGGRQQVDSGMVNDYLREAMGEEFTAKDFRTWAATCAAIVVFAGTPLPDGQKGRPTLIKTAIETVAHMLRNTPTVCRNSYIHPIVIEAWNDGSLHKVLGDSVPRDVRRQERIALSFLRRRLKQRRSSAI
jgi:DNA topoisomerase I